MLRGTRSYFTSFSHFSYKVRPIINLHFTDEESKVSGSWAVSGNLEYKSKRSNPETTVNHSFASDAFSGLMCWEQGQWDMAWPGLCCYKDWEAWTREHAHPHPRETATEGPPKTRPNAGTPLVRPAEERKLPETAKWRSPVRSQAWWLVHSQNKTTWGLPRLPRARQRFKSSSRDCCCLVETRWREALGKQEGNGTARTKNQIETGTREQEKVSSKKPK